MNNCFQKTVLFALLSFQFTAAAASSNVQNTECFPSTAEAANWPVKAIYLHGLFPPSGSNGYTKLEAKNRAKLEALATRLRIKIAVPVSKVITTSDEYGTNHSWRGVTLGSIESMAAKACHDAPLAKPRALIGFSNGGYAANRIGNMKCSAISAYSKILAIGAPDATDEGSCGKLVNTAPHALPGEQYFARHLRSLSGEQVAMETPPVVSTPPPAKAPIVVQAPPARVPEVVKAPPVKQAPVTSSELAFSADGAAR